MNNRDKILRSLIYLYKLDLKKLRVKDRKLMVAMIGALERLGGIK